MKEHEYMMIIECPKCHSKAEHLIMDALDTSVNVYEKEQLLDDNFFKFECRKCHSKIDILHEIVYYDAEHNTTIYLAPGDMIDGVCMTLRLNDRLASKRLTNGYDGGIGRKRVVSCQHQLREKSIIFSCGLDDRIIELIKLICIDRACVDMPDFEVLVAFFNVKDDGRHIIELIGEEKSISALIPDGLYAQLQLDFAEVLEEDDEYVINDTWAMEVMGVEHEMECDGDCANCPHCDHDDDEFNDECTGYCEDCDGNCENCECDQNCPCYNEDDEIDEECLGCERDCEDCDCLRCKDIFDDEEEELDGEDGPDVEK